MKVSNKKLMNSLFWDDGTNIEFDEFSGCRIGAGTTLRHLVERYWPEVTLLGQERYFVGDRINPKIGCGKFRDGKEVDVEQEGHLVNTDKSFLFTLQELDCKLADKIFNEVQEDGLIVHFNSLTKFSVRPEVKETLSRHSVGDEVAHGELFKTAGICSTALEEIPLWNPKGDAVNEEDVQFINKQIEEINTFWKSNREQKYILTEDDFILDDVYMVRFGVDRFVMSNFV